MPGVCSLVGRCPLSVAWLLMLSLPGYCAQRLVPAGGASASASCSVSVGSASRVTETDAFVDNLVEISSFACGADGDDAADLDFQVDFEVAAMASAVAEAVTDINYTCSLQGNATASIRARAVVESQARAVGAAVARVVTDASVCKDCVARIDSFVEQTQEVIAVASLESFVSVDFVSMRGQPVEETRRIFRRSVQANVQEAIASVSVGVRSTPLSEFGCEATGTITASVGDSSSSCNFSAVGAARVIEDEVIVDLGAQVRAFACQDGFAEDSLQVTLTATATALADAVAQVDVACESEGGLASAGCAMGESTIRATAQTTAQAFVEGLVEAGTCFCNESVSVNASAFEEVFAEASAAAYAETCISGSATTFATDFRRELDEQLAEAVAQLVLSAEAIARADSGECLVTQAAGCAAAARCAADHKQCRGDGVSPAGTVLACCSDEFECVRRSAAEARCQRRGAKLPKFYDGTPEPPTVGVELACPEVTER